MIPYVTTDFVTTLTVILLAFVVWAVLFLVCRWFVLWYFKINERTELLKEIRDSLRRAEAGRPTFAPSVVAAVSQSRDPTHRRPGESDDQYNSRLADELQRQMRQ